MCGVQLVFAVQSQWQITVDMMLFLPAPLMPELACHVVRRVVMRLCARLVLGSIKSMLQRQLTSGTVYKSCHPDYGRENFKIITVENLIWSGACYNELESRVRDYGRRLMEDGPFGFLGP